MNLENLNLGGAINTPFGGPFAVASHYDVLNVDQSATRLMIRESYLRANLVAAANTDGAAPKVVELCRPQPIEIIRLIICRRGFSQ